MGVLRSDIGSAGLTRVSGLVAQIEALGWHMEQMSWAPRGGPFRAEGFFFFRRANGQS